MHPPRIEVDAIDTEPQDLPLPEPAARAEVDHRAVPPGEATADCRNLFVPPRHHPTLHRSRRRGRLCRTWILGDPLVVDGRTEDGPQVREDDGPGCRSQLADHRRVPLPDVTRLD
ncbi:hypothetical protein [Micromonospora sp. WMMD712]|uniref:hypothetical protein n=1 Tax=Micromonospora sp. WMMD712 TaxID=3016096 RepID=UPI00249AEF93|nr:hypothetical protein [Micromonospora sp. WMMD712]WFE57327.1 hypothetical protein O7633_10785 [Micromonospora sp. WMMD712]